MLTMESTFFFKINLSAKIADFELTSITIQNMSYTHI